MDHVVEVADLLVGIRQNRVVDRGLLDFVDVADPALVAFGCINTQGDRLDVALLPFRTQTGHLTELGGAHRGVVGRMGEQHHPAIGAKVVEVDRTELGVLGEIGNGIAELQHHEPGKESTHRCWHSPF